jgi:hypothetical protein
MPASIPVATVCDAIRMGAVQTDGLSERRDSWLPAAARSRVNPSQQHYRDVPTASDMAIKERLCGL